MGVAGLRIALVIAAALSLAFALWRPSETGGLLDGIEGRLLDLRFVVRGPLVAPDDVAILAIDDKTLDAYKTFPPPRRALAEAIDTATKAGAKVIALDLLLTQSTEDDDALSAALGGTTQTVLAVSVGDGDAPPPALREAVDRSGLPLVVGRVAPAGTGLLGPKPDLAAKSLLAHVNVSLETDGSLKRIPLALALDEGPVLPAISLAAARAASPASPANPASPAGAMVRLDAGKAVAVAGNWIPLDADNAAVLDYFGPRGTIPTYSLVEAGKAPLKDRVVFIGATAVGFGDTFATPFDAKLPGVEALATLAVNLLEGKTLRRDGGTWAIDVVLAALIGALAAFAASRRRVLVAVAAVAAVTAGTFALLQAAFLAHVWLDGVTALVALGSGAVIGAGFRFLDTRRRASNLSSYHSPIVAESLADRSHPAFGGRTVKVGVLFVDIEGFTDRARRMDVGETATFLRAFHNHVERAALAHAGVVEQFAGDGALITFGLPVPSGNDAANALACSWRLFEEIDAFNASLRGESETPVRIRIGVHFGAVVAAVLGGEAQKHVTIAGDVVNAASRLQEVAKEEGLTLVVAGSVFEAAGTEPGPEFRFLGERALRGRSGELALWGWKP